MDQLFLQLMPLFLIFGVFYFLLIRPQQRRVKEHKAMVESLKKGDKWYPFLIGACFSTFSIQIAVGEYTVLGKVWMEQFLSFETMTVFKFALDPFFGDLVAAYAFSELTTPPVKPASGKATKPKKKYVYNLFI